MAWRTDMTLFTDAQVHDVCGALVLIVVLYLLLRA